MLRLRLQMQRIGPHFRTVLVSGEAGTGKTIAARMLHRLSPGANGSFMVCSAAETFAEGSVPRDQAAVSSGSIDRLVKTAHGGTLFFDDISEMPVEGQTRLLRVLQGQENRMAASQKMDLRIIASTAEDLKVLALAGRFKQELYRRLAMVEIALPPLRERREDIPAVARHLLGRLALQYGIHVESIGEDAMNRLVEHSWPGNVRALEDALRYAVLRCEGRVLQARHLPALAEVSAVKPPLHETARLQDIVEQHVLRVLKSCAGNKLRAAEVLGISRSTLYRMLSADEAANHGRSAKVERYT
jgi:DNA-binding NtrC family response regulator